VSGHPPRVAVLVPYWEFWEASARGDLREGMNQVGQEAIAALDGVDAVATEVLYAAEDSLKVTERLRAAAPEVVLVIQVMAVPPARTMAVLDGLPELPLVVWAMHRRSGATASFNHSEITTEGATVGTSQLTNLLVRGGQRFALEVGRLDDAAATAAVARSLAASAAARRLSQATLARVGEPPSGYDCVTCDMDELSSALGLSVLELEPGELAAIFGRVDDDAVERVRSEALAGFRLADDLSPDDEGLDRSLRLTAALEELDRRHGIDAGAINCHLPELRFSPQVGVTPCFALGRETSRGVPWSCAGDVLTAVAMLTTKLLGGAALYHELERIDYGREELVIANSGEHDLAWADPSETPVLRRNGWFSEDPVCGACACFSAAAGPATLVAFTPHPNERGGFRYVIAEGELTGRSFPETGTANGGFRFSSSAATEGYRRWALAGANHHSSSTPGHLGDQVAGVAAQLGVGAVRID
jgi:L-fucose isomerase-like protein